MASFDQQQSSQGHRSGHTRWLAIGAVLAVVAIGIALLVVYGGGGGGSTGY
jgi:tetrahydromethanopterin S-methyltransferase subunit F